MNEPRRITSLKLRTRGRALAVALLAGFAGSGPAAAQEQALGIEIRGGVLAHDVPGLWSGFNLERGVDINAEVLGRGLPFLFGGLRPALGGSLNTSGFTSKAYLDARWEFTSASGLFFGTGLGAAVHDGLLAPTDPDRKALGSRVLFHIPVEVGLIFHERHSLSIFFEHMSNANTRPYNEGLDDIGVRYGYRF